MNHARRALLVIAAALVAALAGCAGPTSGQAGEDSARGPFNKADVEFATMMITHHAQAVRMAELAGERAERPEVKALAEQAAGTARPEIEQLGDLLRAWGQPVPASDDVRGPDMAGMVHDAGRGMLSPEDLRLLEVAVGADFDRLFVSLLVGHHRGGVEMARTQRETGRNDSASALAERMISQQSQELAAAQRLQ